MKISGLLDEDFINYKLPSMTVMFPYCTFKCNAECGQEVCQNMHLTDESLIDISPDEIVDRYVNNPISEAIVMQGLEPFDSFEDLSELIEKFTDKSIDDIVIYTGYNEDEIQPQVNKLAAVVNDNTLIIKFGRFVPNSESRFDEVLGVTLQSDNQYAKQI